MKSIIAFLMRLGVVEGITFRCEVEDGVGPVLTPNPRVTRMSPRAVSMPANARRIDGSWAARRVYLTDRFPFLQ